jgi:hypothetical protein
VKLNEQALFWLDSWVDPRTNTNEIARANARAVGVHIAGLQSHIQRLEAAIRERVALCCSCVGTGLTTVAGPDCFSSEVVSCPDCADLRTALTADGELIMARTAQQKLIDLLWELTDDSEVHARTGDVLLTLQRQQATEMYKLFWRLGGKYREGLKEVGWSPPPRGRCGPADDPNAPFRWICIHCDTVSGIDDQACLGCKKPRYPALATASGEVKP